MRASPKLLKSYFYSRPAGAAEVDFDALVGEVQRCEVQDPRWRENRLHQVMCHIPTDSVIPNKTAAQVVPRNDEIDFIVELALDVVAGVTGTALSPKV